MTASSPSPHRPSCALTAVVRVIRDEIDTHITGLLGSLPHA
ncbi:hypothetical protein ACFWCA_03925 [Streptomyces phaeochromogenes]